MHADPPARAFLCDDSAMLRRLLREALTGHGVTVTGEAGDGRGLVELVRAARADVVVLDLSMPHVDGFESLAALRRALPELAIVVVSGFPAARMATRALELGADRYIEKSAPMRDICAGVQEALAKRRELR
jgi:two-component system, NarL family, invasion response regulator UvrY